MIDAASLSQHGKETGKLQSGLFRTGKGFDGSPQKAHGFLLIVVQVAGGVFIPHCFGPGRTVPLEPIPDGMGSEVINMGIIAGIGNLIRGCN